MSHFSVTVVCNDVEEVTELISPYYEGLEVKKHREKCYCVGEEASVFVRKKVENEFGCIEDLRKIFHTTTKDEEEIDKEWNQLIKIEERRKREKELFSTHKDKDKPDKSCANCKGKGWYMTTSNPDAKWDWWVLGGRWTGHFTGKNVEDNPNNFEKCFCCQGTGMRNDELGKESRQQDPTYTCNGCQGTGKTLKFHYEEEGKDVIKVKEFLKKDLSTYAVVTPDGEWHQRGRMGWFGMSSDEKEDNAWKEEIKELLKPYPNYLAVLVDCHI